MASYDELHLLDDIGDQIDDVYDLEGYGEVRKAYDELSGYDVYRQWIEPELVEKRSLSPKEMQQRRDAAKSRARKAGGGGMVDRARAWNGRRYANNVARNASFLGSVSGKPWAAALERRGSANMFRNPVAQAAYARQAAALGINTSRAGMPGFRNITFTSAQARSTQRKKAVKRLALEAALLGGALGGASYAANRADRKAGQRAIGAGSDPYGHVSGMSNDRRGMAGLKGRMRDRQGGQRAIGAGSDPYSTMNSGSRGASARIRGAGRGANARIQGLRSQDFRQLGSQAVSRGRGLGSQAVSRGRGLGQDFSSRTMEVRARAADRGRNFRSQAGTRVAGVRSKGRNIRNRNTES